MFSLAVIVVPPPPAAPPPSPEAVNVAVVFPAGGLGANTESCETLIRGKQLQLQVAFACDWNEKMKKVGSHFLLTVDGVRAWLMQNSIVSS